MTSVLSTLNPLFEKNQTLTKSIYTSFNRSTREGVKKDSANSLVNTDGTESLHYNNDNLVFDSTSGPSAVIISSEGNITAKGNLTIGGVFNGTCTNATNAINADHAKSAANANIANDLTGEAKAALQTTFDGRYLQSVPDTLTLEDLSVVNPINGSIERADTSATADVAKGFTDGAKLALQTSFDSRYLQSVPDTLTLKDLSVTNQITGSIQSAATSNQADIANGLTDAATKTLQDTFDSRYLQNVPDDLTLKNLSVTGSLGVNFLNVVGSLYTNKTIKGNVETATTADTAKALTDNAKTALQTEFDERYLQQSILNNYNPVKVASFEQTYNDLGTITATLNAQTITSITSFTVVGITLPSDCKNVLGYFETYTLKLEVTPAGGSYVETVVGKKDGSQGIVSLFLDINDSFKPLPLSHTVTSITCGDSGTSGAKVVIFGQGNRFTTTMTASKTLFIKYYSANYTKYNMKWTPAVYLNRTVFYQSK